MHIYFYIKLITVILLAGFLSCQTGQQSEKGEEKLFIHHYSSLYNRDTLYHRLLQDITMTNELKFADSLLSSLLYQADIRQDELAIKKLLVIFFTLPELVLHSKQAKKNADQATEILFKENDPVRDWNLIYALFYHYLQQMDETKTMAMAAKLQEKTTTMNFAECKALAYAAIGQAYDLNGNYKFAVSHLFEALSLISNSIREDIQIQILDDISSFYENHHMFENALAYKKRELALYKTHTLLDSIQYYHAQLEYQDLLSMTDENRLFDTKLVHEIIQFAKKENCRRLYEFASAFLRTTLIDSDKIEDLNQYFFTLSEEEKNDLSINTPHIYFLLKAFEHETNHDVAQASSTFQQALTVVNQERFPVRQSFFYLQYARFLERTGKKDEAVFYYENAYNLAKEGKNQDFQMKAAKAAESFFQKTANYQKAYYFASQHYGLLEKKTMTSRDQDVYRLEIETEQKILENNKMLEEARTKKVHQVQYNLIALLILLVFIILLISVRFKIPIWLIRVIGYMAVIFIFEFCIIHIDHFIHEITHHTPWKVFSIKVMIISIILPVHHIVEKKLIKFLINRRESETDFIAWPVSFYKKWLDKLDKPDLGDQH